MAESEDNMKIKRDRHIDVFKLKRLIITENLFTKATEKDSDQLFTMCVCDRSLSDNMLYEIAKFIKEKSIIPLKIEFIMHLIDCNCIKTYYKIIG